MNTQLITAPAEEPITINEASDNMRVTATAEDSIILRLIQVARRRAESITGRCFVTQTRELSLDEFPCDVLEMPDAPLQSVVSVKYVESAFPYVITLQGPTAPLDANGVDGDVYWDTATDNIYLKAASTWGAALRTL